MEAMRPKVSVPPHGWSEPRRSQAPWKTLRVGDRVRFVRMPSGIDAAGYVFPRETRLLYERLIASGRSRRVREIDDWGIPWIWCRSRARGGRVGWEMLAINDDSWVRVRSRSGGKSSPRGGRRE